MLGFLAVAREARAQEPSTDALLAEREIDGISQDLELAAPNGPR